MEKDKIKYGIFKRSDMDAYQAIAGGGEEGETILESAQRELLEETGLRKRELIKLDSVASIPASCFKESKYWGKETYVVNEYAFAVLLNDDDDITLSSEHLFFEFVDYDKAREKLKYDSNRTALYELNERIKNNDLF